jgi:hypothetical protein
MIIATQLLSIEKLRHERRRQCVADAVVCLGEERRARMYRVHGYEHRLGDPLTRARSRQPHSSGSQYVCRASAVRRPVLQLERGRATFGPVPPAPVV